MNLEQARFNMIEQQIRTWNVLDTDVLHTLVEVHREAFVPPAYRALAFVDSDIPLPCGQNMLSPKVEARILQAVAPRKDEDVLEIGAGSGYMAALLAARARHVTTVEIERELKLMAEANLVGARVNNVKVEAGDGAQGWNGGAHYGVIVISGSLPVLPEAFLKQLNVGGRLFAVVGGEPVMTAQLVTRTAEDAWETRNLFETQVKPLRNAVVPSAFQF